MSTEIPPSALPPALDSRSLIGVDGVITAGESSIDQSAITGGEKAVSIWKTPAD